MRMILITALFSIVFFPEGNAQNLETIAFVKMNILKKNQQKSAQKVLRDMIAGRCTSKKNSCAGAVISLYRNKKRLLQER